MRRKILITLGIFLLVVIVLLAGLFYASQTEPFRDFVRKTAQNIVSSTTGQTFTIGDLEGNFFNDLRLKDVSMTVEGDKFFSVDELAVDFSLMQMLSSSYLFSQVIPVDELSVKGIDVNLVRYEDGRWIYEKLGGDEKDEEKKSSGPPGWSILLSKFMLENATITTDDRISGAVSKYEIPEIELSVKLINIYEDIELNLKTASLSAPGKNISVKDLSTKAAYTGDSLVINNLILYFNDAAINVDLEAESLKSEPSFSLNASVKNYSIENVGDLGVDINLEGKYVSKDNIELNGKIDFPQTSLYDKTVSGSIDGISMNGTTIEIKNGNIKSDLGNVTIDGESDIKGLLTKEGNNNFNFDVKLENIKTSEILTALQERTEQDVNAMLTDLGASLNGDLNLSGSWKEFSDITVKADLNDLTVSGKEAGNLEINGSAEYSGSVVEFDMQSVMSKVDLGVILADQNLSSDITSDAQLKGSVPLDGDIAGNMNAYVKADIKPSSFSGVKFTQGNVDVSYDRGALEISAFTLNADDFNLEVSGGAPSRDRLDIAYDISARSLGFLSGLIGGKELSGSLNAKGQATGMITAPTVTIEADGANIEFDGQFIAESLELSGEATLDPSNPDANLQATLSKLEINDRAIESVEIKTESLEQGINVEINIRENESFSYYADAAVTGLDSSERNILIKELKLDLEDTELKNRENISLTIAPRKLVVQNFNLYYKDSSALANADIFYDGKVDADLKINNLNLDDITKAIQFKTPLQGSFTASFDMSGTMQNPQINARIESRGLQYKKFENDNISLNLSYLGQNMTLKLLITDNNATVMQATGNANINLDLKNISQSLDSGTFNLSIDSSGIDLSPLASISEEIEESEGMLIVNLKASGKLKDPTATGQISLKDAVIKTQTLGNPLEISEALLEMQGKKAILSKLAIQSGGTANLNGELDLSTLKYNLAAELDGFTIKPKRIRSSLSGNLDVRGEGAKTFIEGNIEVRKTRVTIPDHPQKEVAEIKFADEDQKEEFVISAEDDQTDYFKENIGLKLNVRLRKNNWVRGRGANIEIRGSLDINKDYEETPIIVGEIRTVRGTYETFGKLFRIESGNVSFSGTREINPFLDITALYRVSSVNIYIDISGTANEPKIDFRSDPAMTQTNIISYLVFGVASDDISSGQRSSVQGIAGSLAGGIAAQQLENMLGSTVSLDVINIGNTSDGAQIELGKYITEDLYVAYERGTSESILDSDNITYNKVLVEYQLYKNITLDGDFGGENPGVDIFYNFNY